MKGKYKDDEEIRETIKKSVPATSIYLQNKNMFDGLPRQTNMFKGSSLLNEENIREELK